MTSCAVGERARPGEVRRARGVAFAGLEQARQRERPDRLQHPIAARALLEDHEALVYEAPDEIEHFVGVGVVERPEHAFGAFHREAADEHTQAPQRRPLLLVEEGLAPRD